jgi:hypothetical protein
MTPPPSLRHLSDAVVEVRESEGLQCAGYGAVETGDLLVTSPTPGHAMSAPDAVPSPGTVLGKALEPLDTGQGTIRMLVMMR